MKRKIIFIIIGVILVLGIVLSPFIYSKMGMVKLQRKVIYVNNLFAGKTSVSKVEEKIKKSVSNKKDIDKSLNKYLNDLIKQYSIVDSINNNKTYKNMFKISEIDQNVFQNDIKLLEEDIEKVDGVNKSLTELITDKKINSYSDKDNINKYKKVISKLNKNVLKNYIKEIESFENDLNKEIEIIKYLDNNHEQWSCEDKTLEFKKRDIYDNFVNMEKSSRLKDFSYRLIDDKTPPEIQAEDYTIYLYGEINLDEKIHCYDEVDGDVECKIDGSYDASNIGTYPIKITSTDKNNNQNEKTININVIKKVNTKPYSIDVLRNQNVVIVYGQDSNGDYTNIVKVFVCSTGKDNATPTGTFSTTRGSYWGGLFGNVWGQYTTRIVDHILFHSVPYYSANKNDLEWEEYNKLGTQASLGCIRLAVRDVKWIFENCPNGTTVRIYDGDLPAGVSKPAAIKIDGNSPNRGWDPTDDDPANPWNS